MSNQILNEMEIKKIRRDSMPVSHLEFKTAFERLTGMIKMAVTDLQKQYTRLVQMEDEFIARMDKRLLELKGKDGISPDPKKIVAEVLKNIRQPKDGETPIIDYQKIAGMVLAMIPTPKDGASVDENGVIAKLEERLGASVQSKIETLQSDKKLNVKMIDGITEHIVDVMTKHSYSGGGGSALSLLSSGSLKVQSAQALNFKGSGAPTVTIGSNGVTNLDFSGGGFSKLAATETPDGNILVFTFATASVQPSFLIIDGVWSEATNPDSSVNWTWNAGLKQATLAIPPNKSIKGIV